MDKEEIAVFIGEKIKYYRKLNNWTQEELGRKIGIGKNAVGNYERGFRSPKKDTVFALANAFDISIDDLFPPIDKTTTSTEAPKTVSDEVLKLDRDLHKDNHKSWINYGNKLLDKQNTVTYSKNTVNEPQTTYYTYNYYDQPASAGTGQYLNDVQVEQIELPVDIDADFVVPIYGDSMEPEYHSGDYVFVKLSVDLSNGDIGVFEYYGDAYIKELVINDYGAYLHSLNSKYNDIPVDADSDFRIIGEVVGRYSEK
ncbi:MAG: XRE family transcriptional regulator [Streptococcus orisratti]|uniref:helix-turn-helix domain-containing protein n=1 Tax=Streptococcus orisratti TaxID=114652 RepID=UPI002A91EAA1|nr:XRE family transcriptional regulator [Streptococcus orisratti]MDY5636220.1 XRE family transcriptional regulator [Streptococcus orisratti]